MNICYIIWKFKSPKNFMQMGGAEKQLLKSLQILQNDKNVHITIISRKTKNDPKIETFSKNIQIYRLLTSNIPLLSMIIFMISLSFRLLRINKNKKIDLFHLFLPDVYILSVYLIRFILKIPLITRVAGDELDPFRKRGLWRINREIVKHFMLKSDGIQTLSDFAYNQALKLGYKSNRLFLIPNGVIVPDKYRDYTSESKIIAYVGAMRFFPKKSRIEQKNLVFLLKTFKDLLEHKPELKLYMIGDGNFRSHLEGLCRELEINRNVIFTGYLIDIADQLLSVDIFLNPSRYEGLPNTVLEAMSYGLYVLCSDIPEHRFILKNNEFGDLFNHNDSNELITKIMNFYEEKKIYTSKAEKARIFISDNFSMENTVEKIVRMYNEVTKNYNEKN